MAAGEGSGSIVDLKWPAVNFIVLLSFLIFKLRGPLRESFDKNAEEVTFLAEQAENKNRQAQIRLDTYKKKMAGIESEHQKMAKDMERERERYAARAERATREYIDRLKQDFERKMIQEKHVLGNRINVGLVDEVVKKAKTVIAGDGTLKEKVAQRLISHMN